MPAEADWFKRDPDAPDEYAHGMTWSAWKAWQEAVKQERERSKELLLAAKRVAYSNGFDAAYPDNLEALKAICRARSEQGKEER